MRYIFRILDTYLKLVFQILSSAGYSPE